MRRSHVLTRGGNRLVTPLSVGLGLVGTLVALLYDPLLGGSPGFGLDQILLLCLGVALLVLGLAPAQAASKLLAVASVLLSLALTELGLRLWSHGPPPTIYRLDDRWLHTHVSGARKTFVRSARNGGQQIEVRINSRGFRGEELLPPGAAHRIVVYGDSSIAAEFSELEDTFPEQLESALEASLDEPVEAINAGVVAYGPDQIAVRMEDELDSLRPELAVVAIFVHNDFGDLVRDKLYRLEDGQAKRNRPSFGSQLRLQETYRRARQWSLLYGTLLSLRSQLPPTAQDEPRDERNWAAERASGLLRSQREVEDYERSDVIEQLFLDPYDYDVSLEPDSSSARTKTVLMDAVIGQIEGIAARHSVPLLFVVIPSKFDASELDGLTPPDPLEYPAYRRQNLSDSAVRAIARRGLACIDLFDEFWHQRGRPLYFVQDDHHWNHAAQSLAAKLTAKRILAEGWLARR